MIDGSNTHVYIHTTDTTAPETRALLKPFDHEVRIYSQMVM